MYILALETTGAFASAAIINERKEVIEKHGDRVFSHLQCLMPMVDSLINENGLRLGDLDAIAVSEGPGSFTGIRIGVSSARALGQVLKIPVVGVPTLKAFAYNIQDFQGLICPIFDARRNQVYAGAYEWKQGEIVEAVEGAPYDINDFLQQIERCGAKNTCYFGDGIKVYQQYIDSNLLAPEPVRLQQASSVAKLGLELYMRGLYTDYGSLTPNYMRKAEAERKLEEKAKKNE